MVAGNETTRHTITHSMRYLIDNPDQLHLLQARPELIPWGIEEFLRMASPVYHFRRTAVKDTEIGDKKVKAGDKVVTWFASGNRDPEVFDDPYRMDVTRNPNEHMTLRPRRPHMCLGNALARLEIRIMFETMLPRIKGMQALGPVDHLRSNFVNGVKRFPVRGGACVTAAPDEHESNEPESSEPWGDESEVGPARTGVDRAARAAPRRAPHDRAARQRAGRSGVERTVGAGGNRRRRRRCGCTPRCSQPATRSPKDDPLNLAYIPAAPTRAAAVFDSGDQRIQHRSAGCWEAGAGAIHAENEALDWLDRTARLALDRGRHVRRRRHTRATIPP